MYIIEENAQFFEEPLSNSNVLISIDKQIHRTFFPPHITLNLKNKSVADLYNLYRIIQVL